MDASHHMAPVMEVNLTTWRSPNTLVDRINAVPGLKTSAAFFSFLRANLVLPPSEMSSNVSTPVLGPTAQMLSSMGPVSIIKGTINKEEPPSRSAAAATDTDTTAAATLDDDIPPLSLGVLATRVDKVDALRLIADSVAQQRQTAARSLALHPLNLAGLVGAGALAHQLVLLGRRQPQRGSDLGSTVILLAGVVMTYLVAIRYATVRYLRLAEAINWEYLGRDAAGGEADEETDGEQDLVLGTRFDGVMICAILLRLERVDNGHPATATATTRHGVIRAWTTKLRFRRNGVGRDLLEEAVRVTRARCGRDADVVFAQDHANSTMVLPEMYNAPFRQSARRAEQRLASVLASLDAPRGCKR